MKIIIIVSITLYTVKSKSKKNEERESFSIIDKAIEIQQSSINEISKDLQAFQDPLSKLNRYLSGGTLAGKFGEWSLEAIIKDIFHTNHYESNAEVIPGSGKRVEFVVKLPEGLLLLFLCSHKHLLQLFQNAEERNLDVYGRLELQPYAYFHWEAAHLQQDEKPCRSQTA